MLVVSVNPNARRQDAILKVQVLQQELDNYSGRSLVTPRQSHGTIVQTDAQIATVGVRSTRISVFTELAMKHCS